MDDESDDDLAAGEAPSSHGVAGAALAMTPVVHTSSHEDSPMEPHIGGPLDEVDLALARMVCQPKNRWRFDELRGCTQEVFAQAQTGAERDRAQRLIDRIAQFEQVRRQALGLPPEPAGDSSSRAVPTTASRGASNDGLGNRLLPASSNQDARDRAASLPATASKPAAALSEAAPPSNWEDSRFDGTGRLVPLEKRADGDPQFLLVDAQGVARYFVTPAPGVNLRYYRDRVVGISGSRAEDPERGKPHLTAHRVSLLPDAPPRR
jgi:hypothetical protein